jgi:hypothetical protein
VSKGAIKAEISRFQLPRRSPIQLMRLHRGVGSQHKVSSKEPCLQFARPIEKLGGRQNRVAGQAPLLFKLVEFSLVKASKFRSQPAKGPNETKLRLANIHHKTKPRILRKLKTIFGFRLDLGEGVSHYQIICDQLFALVRGKCQIPGAVGEIEGPDDQIASGCGMFGPRRNTVTEIDGAASSPLWRVNFLNSGAGIATVPAGDVACPFIAPEIGITPTPAIDLPSGTIYVLARTKEGAGAFSSGRYVQKLHALAVTTGAEKFGGPVEIKASVKGRGPGGAMRDVAFDPLRELPRAALLLVNGQVYLTWGSSCDVGPYHGWAMAYDARTLAQTAVFNTSPDAEESGIWQSDNGPAADDSGNVYVATGKGEVLGRRQRSRLWRQPAQAGVIELQPECAGLLHPLQ